VTVCKRWPTASDELFNGTRPTFIRAAEGLITTGMIFLSFGLIAAIFAIALPFLAYLAALLAFIAFIVLVIGLPIFGRQSNNLSQTRGDVSYNKRYGFWLIVPTIVLEFLAILFFLAAGLLYKFFGYGNLLTSSGNQTYGGRQMLGKANRLNVPPMMNMPYGMRAPGLFGAGGMVSAPYAYPPLAGETGPSLLSEYLSQRIRPYDPIVVRTAGMSVLPQPSIVRTITSAPVPNVTPAYLRVGEPVGPSFQPIINLTGQTLVGPLQRIS
jgi:hypothetical protein